MSYFDLDALSVDDERIPCLTNLEAPGLGHLDPANSSEDLPANSKVASRGSGRVRAHTHTHTNTHAHAHTRARTP